MSQPRAELFAVTITTDTGETVTRSLNIYHKSSIKLTDRQIILHWLHTESKQLEQWTRNRAREFCRFTDKSQCKYISSTDMIADIGKCEEATIGNVNSITA